MLEGDKKEIGIYGDFRLKFYVFWNAVTRALAILRVRYWLSLNVKSWSATFIPVTARRFVLQMRLRQAQQLEIDQAGALQRACAARFF